MVDGFAADEEDGTNCAGGGDGNVGKDDETGDGGVRGGGNNADVGGAARKFSGALRGHGVGDFEAWVGRAMFEIPHEGGGVEVGDGGDAHGSCER